MKQRIYYLDIAKALGMFAVYFGHFGAEGGYGYAFAFYCVPLFFFVAGCTEGMMCEQNAKEYIQKKVRTILIPYFVFAIFSIVIHVIEVNSLDFVRGWGVQVLKGCIRNSFFAGTLWFLSCLFVITLIFLPIRKMNSKIGVLVICVLFYIVAACVLPNRPSSNPSWLWNIDSALEYIVYYALGYVGFPFMRKIVEGNRVSDLIIKGTVVCVSALYGVAVFLGYDLIVPLMQYKVLTVFHALISNVLVILFWLTVSYILQDIKILREVGKNSLFLCGNEWIIKEVADAFLGLFGVSVIFITPLAVWVLSFVLLILGVKFVVPIEKTVLKRLRIM